MQHMEKASLYNVDGNRVATSKQLYAVGNHFGKLHGATPSEAFRLGKVFGAIMLKFNAEHCDTPITHGDVSKFFELDKVPTKFLERITVRAPKAAKTSKKSIAAKKTSEKSEKVIVAKTAKTSKKSSEMPKASDQSLTDFQARLDAIDARFNKVETAVKSHDKKLASIDAKMDLIMAFLETDPDA
jgi:hypothetical protein